MADGRLLVGDARDTLPGVAAGSVHCAVVSIPYRGQRVYDGVEPAEWGGDPDCEHVWGDVQPRPGNEHRNGLGANSEFAGREDKRAIREGLHPGQVPDRKNPDAGVAAAQTATGGQWCQRCGAWLGLWGLEPTLALYVEHCVEFFRHVRRVLRDDGSLWLNIGDSYAGTGFGKGTGNFGQKDNPHALTPSSKRDSGLKPGDLCGVPWRVAFALQADGWYLRSAIVWAKGLSFCTGASSGDDLFGAPLPPEGGYSGSVMPESVSGTRWERCRVKVASSPTPVKDYGVAGSRRNPAVSGGVVNYEPAKYVPCPGCAKCRDTGGYVLREGRGRPTSAYEMVFLLTPSEKYYWDAEAMREGAATAPHPLGNRKLEKDGGATSMRNDTGRQDVVIGDGTRNVRNVWVIGPEPLSLPHYAAYPRALPRHCIEATCPRYCCPECGRGWARVVADSPAYAAAKGDPSKWASSWGHRGFRGERSKGSHTINNADRRTLGWLPTCTCQDDALEQAWRDTVKYRCPPRTHNARKRHQQDVSGRWEWRARRRELPRLAVAHLRHVPGTALDPCMGSGTTALAAIELGRRWLGCEPSEGYVEMANKRIQEHTPDAALPTLGDLPPDATLFAQEAAE